MVTSQLVPAEATHKNQTESSFPSRPQSFCWASRVTSMALSSLKHETTESQISVCSTKEAYVCFLGDQRVEKIQVHRELHEDSVGLWQTAQNSLLLE